MDNSIPPDAESLYGLGDGSDIRSRAGFSSPVDEYLAAFADADRPFLYHCQIVNGRVETQLFTRGRFLELSRRAATCLIFHGLERNDRIAHCFSGSSPYDLTLRLAEIMAGAVRKSLPGISSQRQPGQYPEAAVPAMRASGRSLATSKGPSCTPS